MHTHSSDSGPLGLDRRGWLRSFFVQAADELLDARRTNCATAAKLAAVEVLEVSGVATPERIARRLDGRRAGVCRLRHHRVHLGPGRDVMADREVGCAGRGGRKPRVVRDARARPECELEARLQIEKRDRAVLELRADDTFGFEAEAVAVEAERSLQVIHAQRDERDARLHVTLP